MKEPLVVLTSWGGAQYLDWWLVVHFFGGLALGYVCRMYGFSLFHAFVLVGVVLVGWELYETLAHIPEPWTNSALDFLIGLMGIWLAYKIILFEKFSTNFWLAGSFLLIWGGLNLWGWFAWQAREAEAAKMETQSGEVITTADH